MPLGTASFGASNTTTIDISTGLDIGSLTFNAGVSAYTFSNADFSLSGAGIVNNSSQTQTINIVGGVLALNNSATLGNAVVTSAGSIDFNDSTSAGRAVITNNGGNVSFDDNSTAANATISNNAGGTVNFTENSSGGTARYIGNSGMLDISGLGSTGMAIGSVEGAGPIVLGAKALTVGGNNLSTTMSGVISGIGGSLVKQGTGTMTLTGANTFTGGTTVNAGGLLVNGSLASGVTVGSAGLLGGSGTITGSVINGGIVAPGNSIGTLTVSGSFTQNSGGSLQIEANAGGQSDRVNVTGAPGTAALNGGTLAAQPIAGGIYAMSTTYTVLNATGGRTGTFANVTSSLPFLTPSLSYDANNVYLTLVPGDFARGALTGNQRAVGGVLDRSVAPPATSPP